MTDNERKPLGPRDIDLESIWAELGKKYSKIIVEARPREDCLLCDQGNQFVHRIITQNELFYARWNNTPKVSGHADIIPKRHIKSFFDLDSEELQQMHILLRTVRGIISRDLGPNPDDVAIDSYSVIISDNLVSESPNHFHIEIIPQYIQSR